MGFGSLLVEAADPIVSFKGECHAYNNGDYVDTIDCGFGFSEHPGSPYGEYQIEFFDIGLGHVFLGVTWDGREFSGAVEGEEFAFSVTGVRSTSSKVEGTLTCSWKSEWGLNGGDDWLHCQPGDSITIEFLGEAPSGSSAGPSDRYRSRETVCSVFVNDRFFEATSCYVRFLPEGGPSGLWDDRDDLVVTFDGVGLIGKVDWEDTTFYGLSRMPWATVEATGQLNDRLEGSLTRTVKLNTDPCPFRWCPVEVGDQIKVTFLIDLSNE